MICDLPESLLSEPVSAWLAGQGFTVWAEVPFHGGCIDLVGYREAGSGERVAGDPKRETRYPSPGPRHPDPGLLVAVELKTSLSRQVIRQAMINQLAVDFSYAAVGRRPRSRKSLELCSLHGIGVLFVEPASSGAPQVRVILEARTYGRQVAYERERIIQRIGHMEPGGLAGLPSLAGCGPAQECQRAIEAYRAEHPRATWAELFANIPNHYASARSMQSAMRSNRERLAYRERMKAKH